MRKEFGKIAFILIILLLVSCGTKKQITDIERNLSTTASVVDSSSYRDSTLILEQIFNNEDIRVKVKVIEWSKPDSLGKQFPIKTTQADLTNTKNEVSTTTTKQGSELDKKDTIDFKQDNEEKINEIIEKDNRLIPAWFWWALLIVVFISMIWSKIKIKK